MYQSGGPPSFPMVSSYSEAPSEVPFATVVFKGVNVAGVGGGALLEVADDNPVCRLSEC